MRSNTRGWRWWGSRLALAVTAPLLLLILLEVGFRIADVGYATDFLLSAEVDGEPVWVENPFYTYQLFTPPMARVPVPFVAAKQKPDDLFRVVVIGESAAQGDPIPDFGPARVLEYTLKKEAPTERIEVIPAAITAINSHTLRDMARELPKLQPDVVIIYVGNNEVIGPYGPGTVFARFLPVDAGIRWATRLQQLRVAQALRFVMFLLAQDRDEQVFEGVGLFMDQPVRHDDPRLNTVRRRYQRNLQAMIRAAQRAGAQVVLSTVAVNRTDCPPSLPMHRPDLLPGDRAQWRQAVEAGRNAAAVGAWPSALRQFERAWAIDNEHAEVNYWLGVTHRAQGATDVADTFFDRALELDAFRFRADAAGNAIIRDLAAGFDPPLPLADADAWFRDQATPDDRETFLDHVHFSFAGTVSLARLWADTIQGLEIGRHLLPEKGRADQATLRSTLVYSAFAEMSVLQQMRARFRRPPFSRHAGIEERVRTMTTRIEALNAEIRAQGPESLSETYALRIETYPDDTYFRMHYATHLLRWRQYVAAIDVLQPFIDRYPHRRGPRSLMAVAQAALGGPESAASVLFDYQRKHGYFAVMSLRFMLGELHRAGQFSEAAEMAEAMQAVLRPTDFGWLIAQDVEQAQRWHDYEQQSAQHLLAGDLEAAEEVLIEWARAFDGAADAYFRLALIDRQRGEREKAFAVVQHAMSGMGFARAQYHAGIWQLQAGRLDAARDHLQQARAWAGDDIMLVQSLALLFQRVPELEHEEGAGFRLLDQLIERMKDHAPAGLVELRDQWAVGTEIEWTADRRPWNVF